MCRFHQAPTHAPLPWHKPIPAHPTCRRDGASPTQSGYRVFTKWLVLLAASKQDESWSDKDTFAKVGLSCDRHPEGNQQVRTGTFDNIRSKAQAAVPQRCIWTLRYNHLRYHSLRYHALPTHRTA